MPEWRNLAASDRQRDDFGSTRWSVVMRAGGGSSPSAQAALAALCETYREPVLAFIRRRVTDLDLAQDLTQGFFQHVLEKNPFGLADAERGKFRAFLLTCVKNFVSHEQAKARAAKRGGGRGFVSLDTVTERSHRAMEPADHLTAEQIFDQQWARSILQRSMATLGDEYRRSNRSDLFEKLRPFIAGETTESYKDVALQLGITPGAAAVATTRLRKRFAAILRGEIAETVSGPECVEDEIRHLFQCLRPADSPRKV